MDDDSKEETGTMNTTKHGIGGIQVQYQTNTDATPFETLYAGDDLAAASQAALESAEPCTIYHFSYDGKCEPVQGYANGQATRGYGSSRWSDKKCATCNGTGRAPTDLGNALLGFMENQGFKPATTNESEQ